MKFATTTEPIYKRVVATLFVATVMASISGCASVMVKKLEKSADYSEGLRYYRPAPHVWILRAQPPDKVNIAQESSTEMNESRNEATAQPANDAPKKDVVAPQKAFDTKKLEKTKSRTVSTAESWTLTIVMLPDYSEEYVVTWNAGVGSAATNVTLQDGWNLTGFGTTVDSQVDEMVTAVGTPIATVAAAAAGALVQDANWKGPGLYKLEFILDEKRFKLGEQVLAVP